MISCQKDVNHISQNISNLNNFDNHSARSKVKTTQLVSEIRESPPPIPKKRTPCEPKFIPGTGKVCPTNETNPLFHKTTVSLLQGENSPKLPTRTGSSHSHIEYVTQDFPSTYEPKQPPLPPKSDYVKAQISSIAGEKPPKLPQKSSGPPLPPKDYPSAKKTHSDKKSDNKNKGLFKKQKSKL